jgi:D-alanyl-D-alanine carboxypeptidase
VVAAAALAAAFAVASTALAGIAGTAPAVEAPAYVVVSSVDEAVLAARAPAARRPVASITKLMTVLVTLQHARPREIVTVARGATRVGGASLGLLPGERLSVGDLVIGALVPSANDAATALALYVGRGSLPRFVAMMNEKARTLGLRDTRFANPHGLDQPQHESSARDTVILLRAALTQPFVRRHARLASARIGGGRLVETTNDLVLELPELVGAKTGHTDRAGWSEVAQARRDGVVVTAAVLGAPSELARNRDLAALLRWGLAQYVHVRAVDTRRTYASAAIGWGKPDVGLVAPAAIVRTVRIGLPLTERVIGPAVVPLPVRRGQRLGEVRIFDGDRMIAHSPLVADRSVERPGVAGRVRWYAGRTLHHILDAVS